MDQPIATELPPDAFAYLKREQPKAKPHSYLVPSGAVGVLILGLIVWALIPTRHGYTLQDLDHMREAEKVLRYGFNRSLTPLQAGEIEEAVRTAVIANIDPAALMARASDRRKALVQAIAKERDDLGQELVNGRTRANQER